MGWKQAVEERDSGTFDWTAGTLIGGGSMTIAGTATIGVSVGLDNFHVINTGTLTWTDADHVDVTLAMDTFSLDFTAAGTVAWAG